MSSCLGKRLLFLHMRRIFLSIICFNLPINRMYFVSNEMSSCPVSQSSLMYFVLSSIVDAGKESWPELVGAEGRAAAAIIERENPHVFADVLHVNAKTIMEFRCDRVRVRVNDNGVVVRIPRIG